MGGLRFARFEYSERLQRFLEFMMDGEKHSTREIDRGADVCAVNSAACELRENGFQVVCVRKSRPALYQLLDVEGARALAARMLASREVMRG